MPRYLLFFLIMPVLSLANMLMLGQALANQPAFIFPQTYYFIEDDKPSYAIPLNNRANWQQAIFNGLKRSDEVLWVQTDFEIKTPIKTPAGVFVSVLGSFDAYWDGEYIGSNGKVGNSKNTEIPGIIDKTLLIPQALSVEGKHTLSLRISTQHNPANQQSVPFYAVVSEYDFLIQVPYKRASLPMIMSGALLLFALYSLTIYFTTFKRASYLIFSALSLCILVLIFAESWRGLSPYTYDWQIPRLQLVLVLSCIISVLFTAFFAWFFIFTKRTRLLWISIGLLSQLTILSLIDGYDNRSLYVFLIGIICASGLCLQALIGKQKNALLMLGGLFLFTAPIFINSFSYMDQYFFMSFAALIALMLYTLTQSMSSKQQELVQSQINSARLELELVKRNLQPHFILNTLTAVEEWIEESPSTAVNFIQALADEFRFMAQFSAQKMVRLQDEVDLCKAHLRVMSYRSHSQFSLQCNVENPLINLPPGVILTILENAISHNRYPQGDIVFVLNHARQLNREQIEVIMPVIASKAGEGSKGISLGIGNQYIQARLKESFADNWQMQNEMLNQQWRVSLKIPSAFDASAQAPITLPTRPVVND